MAWIEPQPDQMTVGEQGPDNPPHTSASGDNEVIHVLVVDDHPVVRSALARLLEEHPDIAVVGEASDGQEALGVLASRAADVVVMDAAMPHVDGAQATPAIRSSSPGVAIIAIPAEYSPLAAQMIAAGATAFVPKHAEPEALVQAVVAAAAKTRPTH